MRTGLRALALVALFISMLPILGARAQDSITLDPTLDSLIVLGGIVLVRTFLSLSLQVEIDGRWPWQAKQPAGPAEELGTKG